MAVNIVRMYYADATLASNTDAIEEAFASGKPVFSFRYKSGEVSSEDCIDPLKSQLPPQ